MNKVVNALMLFMFFRGYNLFLTQTSTLAWILCRKRKKDNVIFKQPQKKFYIPVNIRRCEKK